MAGGTKIGDLFVRLGMDITDFSKGIQDTQRKLREQGEAMQSMGEGMTKAITLPLAGVATAATLVFAGFEKEMNRVSALGDIFGEELRKLSDQAMELGAKTQYSAKQAAEAMGNLAAAGFKTNEIYMAMPGLLALAATEQMALADAAQITSDILKGYGFQAEDTQKIADILAKTSATGATSVKELGWAFSYVGPVAKAVGVDFLDAAAALGVLADAGIRGERGGTALRNIINDLSSATPKAADTMKALGINVLDTTGRIKPLRELIAELQPLTTNAAAAYAIFGQRWSEVIPLIDKGGAAFIRTRAEIENFTGAADRMASIIRRGVAGQWEELMSSLETVGIQVGKILAPAIQTLLGMAIKMVNSLGKLAEAFAGMPQSIQVFIIALGGLALVAGPAMVALGMVVSSIGELKVLGPILASIGSSFLTLGTNLNTGKGIFAGFATFLQGLHLKEMLGGVVGGIQGFGNAIIAGFRGIPGALSSSRQAIAEFGAAAATFALDNARRFSEGFKSMTVAIAGFAASLTQGQGIRGALSTIGASITGFIASLASAGGISAALGSAKAALIAFGAAAAPVTVGMGAIVAAGTALAAIAYTIYKHWDDIKAVLLGIWTDLGNAFSSFGRWIMEWIEKAFGTRVAGYISSVWTGVRTFFISIWNGIVAIFQNGLKWIVEGALTAARAIGAGETAKALENWLNKLNGLSTAAKNSAGAMKSMGDESQKAMERGGAAAGSLTKKVGETAFSLKEYRDAQKQAAVATRDHAKEMASIDKVFDRVQDRVKDLPKTFEQFRRAMSEGFNVDRTIRSLTEEISDLEVAANRAANKGHKNLANAIQEQVKVLTEARERMRLYKREFDFDQQIRELDEINKRIAELNSDVRKLPPPPDFIGEWKQQEQAIDDLVAAYRAAGIAFDETLIRSGGQFAELSVEADRARRAFETIRDSGTASAKQIEDAYLNFLRRKASAENKNIEDFKALNTGLFGFIVSSSLRSGAAMQLAFTESVNGFRQTLNVGFKDIFGNLIDRDFKGFATSFQNLGRSMLSSFSDIFTKPFSKQLEGIFDNLTKSVSDWLTRNLFGSVMDGFNGILRKIPVIRNAFAGTFGVGNLAQIGPVITNLAKSGEIAAATAMKTAEIAKNAADTATNAARAATSAAQSAAQAGGAAAKAGTAVATGFSKALNIVNAVSAAVTAVASVLQYFQGRRMEQDIARIEVTTRAMQSQLLSFQELFNKFLPGIQGLNDWAWDYLRYFGQLMATVEECRDRLTDILRVFSEGIIAKEEKTVTGRESPEEKQEKALKDLTGTTKEVTGAFKESERRLKAFSGEVNSASDNLTIMSRQYEALPEIVEPPLHAIAEVSGNAASSLSEFGYRIDAATDRIYPSIMLLGDAASRAGNVIQRAAASIGQSASFAMTKMVDAASDLGNKVSQTTGSFFASPAGIGPAQPAGVYWGAPYTGVTSTPILSLNVNVNNADAQQVANQMVSTWRSRGVDI